MQTEAVLEDTKGVESGLTRCANCGEFIISSKMALHTVTCYRNSIKCKVCGESLKRSMKSQHLNQWRSEQKIIDSIEKDDDKELTMVLDHGVKVDYVIQSNGQSLVHFCAGLNSKACLFLLISRGADIDSIDTEGCTPLIIALQKGNNKVAMGLLDLGANIELK